MGLEEVKEDIIRNAKEQERALAEESKKEIARIVKEAENKVEKTKERSNAEIKSTIETIKKQELASAELENKKRLLEAKKQLIEKVFAEVKKKLESLDRKKNEIYIKKLLEKSKNEIEIWHIYCNKKDLAFLKDYDSEAADIIGGLIAENKEKTVRINYSFESMLESIKENELQNINKILFG